MTIMGHQVTVIQLMDMPKMQDQDLSDIKTLDVYLLLNN